MKVVSSILYLPFAFDAQHNKNIYAEFSLQTLSIKDEIYII